MRPIRPTALIAIAVFAASLATRAMPASAEGARAAPRHFVLVNASYESAVSVAVSPAGQDTFQDVVFGAPLRGGVTSRTIQLPVGECLRNFRITFNDGRTLIYPDIDTCRYHRLRLTYRDGWRKTDVLDRPVAETP